MPLINNCNLIQQQQPNIFCFLLNAIAVFQLFWQNFFEIFAIFFSFFFVLQSARTSIYRSIYICLLFIEILFLIGIEQNETSILCGFTTVFLHCSILSAIAWFCFEGKLRFHNIFFVFSSINPLVCNWNVYLQFELVIKVHYK